MNGLVYNGCDIRALPYVYAVSVAEALRRRSILPCLFCRVRLECGRIDELRGVLDVVRRKVAIVVNLKIPDNAQAALDLLLNTLFDQRNNVKQDLGLARK